MLDDQIPADVTYRADRPDGTEVVLKLRLSAAVATAADGWARLTRVHGDVDPKSIVIEIRHLALA